MSLRIHHQLPASPAERQKNSLEYGSVGSMSDMANLWRSLKHCCTVPMHPVQPHVPLRQRNEAFIGRMIYKDSYDS